MRSAIEKSIYYTDVNNFNTVITFNYTDEKSFKNIIKDLPNNIEIIATFGSKPNNFCYKIFNELFYLYKELLFDKTTSIYLINRKGLSVRLFRETKTLEPRTDTLDTLETLENEKIAIIKIDSVLSEYSPTSYKSYFFYPLVFSAGMVISWKYFSQD